MDLTSSLERLRTFSDRPARGNDTRPLDRTTEIVNLYALARAYNENADTPHEVIGVWCQRAHDLLAVSSLAPKTRAQWQELLLPYFMKSDFLRRCREKPNGYAGDYLTIQRMYDARPSGSDEFGTAVDAWALHQPCPRAVRNRRALIGSFLREVCSNSEFRDQTASVVSLGCGPAAEVFDVLDLNAQFTLVDIDNDALDFARCKAAAAGVSDRIRKIRANIVRMVLRDDDTLPGGQAAFYSLGLIDYFSDEMVVRLLNYIYRKLAPGGSAILGNFRPGHSNEALFQHALDWPLTLRSPADLQRLARRSAFATSPIRIGSEPEGVQIFVQCEKAR